MKFILQKNKLVVLLLIICLMIIYINITKPIAINIQGTYYAKSMSDQCFFSIDTWKRNIFYYTDPENNRFFKGNVIKQDNDSYLLACINIENNKYFPTQTIKLKKNNKKITLTIENEEKEFIKRFDYIVLMGHESDYE